MKKLTTESFIENAKLLHNNRYDYSKSVYINTKTKLIITCTIHGDFEQTPNSHLSKRGCIKCVNLNTSIRCNKGLTKFISQASLIHKNKYDYSASNYINADTPINIKCNIHGDFTQVPFCHLRGQGCSKCKITTPIKYENFPKYLEKFKIIHNDIYSYNNFVYTGYHNKSNITCNIHGDFLCTVLNHLNGKGCPKCKLSKGEIKISNFLNKNNIKFQSQKLFKECKNIRPLPFDFFLSDFNILLEFQGEQHTKEVKWFKNHNFEKRKMLDAIKRNYAIDNNYEFLEIFYNENIEEKLNKFLKLNNNETENKFIN